MKRRKTRSCTKLRRMRISRGLLQIELSELTGINQSTLCEMERRGVRRVDKALAMHRGRNSGRSEAQRIPCPACVTDNKKAGEKTR